MHITPNAPLDDGLLDVTVVGAMSRPEFLGTSRRCSRARTSRIPKVTTFRGAHVELESLDPSIPMEVYADGERVGPLPAHDGSGPRRADRPRAPRSRSTRRRPRSRLTLRRRRSRPMRPRSACGRLRLVERHGRAGDVNDPSCPPPVARESRRRTCSRRGAEEDRARDLLARRVDHRLREQRVSGSSKSNVCGAAAPTSNVMQ